MEKVKQVLKKIASFLGFTRNSPYVRSYVHKTNMRSAIYMSAVIVILESWLVIRQTTKYVIPRLDNASYVYGPFQVFFMFTQQYWLLMTFAIAMLVYCVLYKREKLSKRAMITTLVFVGISIVFCALLPLDIIFTNSYNEVKGREPLGGISLALLLSLYISVLCLDISLIWATVYRYKGKGNNPFITSVLVITFFALTCLIFGIKISYSDFSGVSTLQDGTIIPNPDYKGIICFLMMAMYVGCLLIWRPFISVSILGAIFIGFYELLKTVEIRQFPEGDEINYITFFISLTMICFSIYDQRVSEAKKDEELEILATKDVLTGLYSFDYFLTLCAQRVNELGMKDRDYIYLYLNVTSFKVLNDQRGYEAGNEFLRNVGKILTEAFPDGLVSRKADDHYLIFTASEGVRNQLEKVEKRIRDLDPDIRPGIKVGGYYFDSKNLDPRSCISKARYACAEAKRMGDHAYQRYDSKMQEQYTQVQYVVSHIDEAIEKGWIVAYYQPVVYSRGRELCGVEALARWIDPTYGFLSPGVFIPTLEDSQLAYKLDLAMLELVCKHMRRLLDEKKRLLPTSINFSRADFSIIDVPGEIVKITKKYNIDPKYLHIEITESALLDQKADLVSAMARIKKAGFSIWLDDFGSGYSSFNTLKDYSFDVLKLDMEFLKGFETNEKSKPLISSVINTADKVGMRTLAEGVETPEQADFLESIGCEKLQGYLISRPIDFDTLYAQIHNGKFVIASNLD